MIARIDRYLAATPLPDPARELVLRAARLLGQIQRVMKGEAGFGGVTISTVEGTLADLNDYLKPNPQPAPSEAP